MSLSHPMFPSMRVAVVARGGARVAAGRMARGSAIRWTAAALSSWALMLPTGRAAALAAEVQINLCATPEAAATALHLVPAVADRYEVWYFETADQALFRSGVTARLRIKSHRAELTLKFADQDCAQIDPALLPARRSKCEYDVRGAAAVGAVSISRTLDDDQLQALRARPGELPLVLSPAQIGFLRDQVSMWPLPTPLKLLGPARVQPYRRKGDRFAIEAWQFPTGLRLLEISQKTRLADAPELDASLRARLARPPVAICADQGSPAGTKLRELLER